MLILERGEGQSIIIGGNIRVTILPQRSAGRTRLGIEAPRDIIVDREEIHNRKQQEREA